MDQGEEPKVMEPEKCEGWTWVDYPKVPAPVFLPLQKLLSSKYDPSLQVEALKG